MLGSFTGKTSDVLTLNLSIEWWHWVAMFSWFAALLLIDILIVHRRDHTPTVHESVRQSIAWIFLGVLLGGIIFWAYGAEATGQYFNGYLIEKSLSIDNVFTWSVILSFFTVPRKYQHRVLFWGIFGAITMRVIFVFAGIRLLDRFESVLLLFGGILIYSALKILFLKKDHEFDPSKSFFYKTAQKIIPVSHHLDGHKLFTKEKGRRVATKLFMALLVIEAVDVVFAVDSVPAILAVSREPFIIIASNASAILGMRALYFVFDSIKNKFFYISHALGVLLLFVGVKMIIAPSKVLGIDWFGYHLNTTVSLFIIIGIITLGIATSVLFPKRSTKN